MTIQFVPATRQAAKARIALTGPSGSGKTYTALAIATQLGSTAVIDTQRGAAAKYEGLNGWRFAHYCPHAFSPASLVDALAVASGHGFEVAVVDTLSQYWSGVDGMLDQVDKAARRAGRGNTFDGWNQVRPAERRMIDALLSYPGHVIVTLRVKTEWVIEDDERGKKVPRRVGTKPEQRDNIECEFDIVGDLDPDNTLAIAKTCIPSLRRAVIPNPGLELAETIRDWCNEGDDVVGPFAYRDRALDPDATKDDLLALHATVKAAGLLHAPMLDADSNPTVLGDLIAARGRALSEQDRATS